MASRKNFKKDIEILFTDLQTSLFIADAVRNIDINKFSDSIDKINAFYSNAVTSLQAAKDGKPTARAFARTGKEAYANAKKEYQKKNRANYKELGKKLFEDFAKLSNEIAELGK